MQQCLEKTDEGKEEWEEKRKSTHPRISVNEDLRRAKNTLKPLEKVSPHLEQNIGEGRYKIVRRQLEIQPTPCNMDPEKKSKKFSELCPNVTYSWWDGTPSHCEQEVSRELTTTLEDRWIRRLGPQAWPPPPVNSREELKQIIIRASEEIWQKRFKDQQPIM
ncbi:hypothetical protein JTB14_017545 [Gonioctena quinquepunctata]|nr:hypothetical protein JTB14_017545 [Gonioctena quinquepunctata]